ncbi:DUF2326 domain-containing protein [Solibacillus sp. FSL R7-0668]|uniref:DUF2326 domain-containing protein n=1 Tax=Solibacillus sp. FSL R7-0668 TaxID=2921688 RepID=UPI0030F5C3E7
MVKLYINYIGTLPIKGKADVTLRRGLNVVFAEKVIVDEDDGPRNSLGKSTFIRLIDYGLGSTNFFQKKQTRARQKLNNHYLLMEITINETNFTLCRNLINNDENFIYKGWVKERLTKNDSVSYIRGPSLEDYKEFIEESLLQKENYINDEKIISLRGYLPLLIRNQLDGFSNIYQPLGMSEGQPFSRLRTEFFSGLSTHKKLVLEQQFNKAEEKRKQASQDLNTLTRYLKKKELTINFEEHLLNYESEFETLSNEIKLIKERLLTRNNEESLIRKQLDLIEINISKLNSDIDFNESRILNYQATINDIYKELDSLNLFITAENFFKELNSKKCPTCLQDFDLNNMTQEKYEEKSTASLLIKEILSNEISDLTTAIDDLRTSIHYDKVNLIAENRNRLTLLEKLNTYTKDLVLELDTKENILNTLKQQHADVLYLKSIQEDIKDYSNNMKSHVKTKQTIKEKIDNANLEIEDNKSKLKIIYDNVVRHLYNNTRQGILKFSPKANNIEVDVAYLDSENNIDSGAAAQNVKVIAFDLALLELSLTNSTYHPRFLIHDSPNVNDIDLDVYYRIFTYILKLEESELQNKGIVDFQYIITTIYKPEEVLEQHIILQLESGNEGGKLFGFTF